MSAARARWLSAPIFAIAAAAAAAAVAGPDGGVTVRVRFGAAPVSAAEVRAEAVSAYTDARGEVRLTLSEGEHTVEVRRDGFGFATVPVTVHGAEEISVTVQLQEARLEEEVVVVSATRSGRVVADQPIRVEALPQEEIEENQTIAPGNLTTLLNELGGLRVQTTSPALGGSSLRLQGLGGRYTQILLDELPLYGGQVDGFGLLQTPPLDLDRVEVLKGAKSALYGGRALGGLVNLVSRLPGSEPEVLVNQSSRGGTDAVGFVSGGLGSGWGYTLLGGGHRQREVDADDDGWADLPGYWRTEARPRFFFNDGAGRSLLVTVGAMVEEREGGTLDGAVTPAGTPFRERLHTVRGDGGVVGRFLLANERLVTVRASVTGTRHDRTFGDDVDSDRRGFALGEAALSGTDRGHTWTAGVALQRDAYRSRGLPAFDFTHLVPAVFAQDECTVGEHLAFSASGRVDFDDEHGTFWSPLLSALFRPGAGWNLRLSAGAGYAAPVPFTEDTEVVGLWRVLPLRDGKPERARTVSLDAGWSRPGLEVNGTLFASEIRGPLVLREAAGDPGAFEIVNAPGPTRTYGSELLSRVTAGPLHLIATYTYLRATEADPGGAARRSVPLTPRHAGELACIWEDEDLGRVGFELSYSGGQTLEDDPYRATSPSYFEWSVLGEAKLGEARLFVNAVNLTNVRQTRFDPLVLPARAPDGRWTTDAWAPLGGRVVNAGVRFEF
jgi:iron complex outermembrane receptor protein